MNRTRYRHMQSGTVRTMLMHLRGYPKAATIPITAFAVALLVTGIARMSHMGTDVVRVSMGVACGAFSITMVGMAGYAWPRSFGRPEEIIPAWLCVGAAAMGAMAGILLARQMVIADDAWIMDHVMSGLSR